jgi:mono/diheme cytochrome c family protein
MGKAIFQNVCAACHGFDGKAINWGSEEKPKYVGTEAQSNPWEVLHKIRAGHPGVEMPALMAFPIQDAVNVLKYAAGAASKSLRIMPTPEGRGTHATAFLVGSQKTPDV